MLASEHIQPHRLGYDRPSPKLLGFLRKYYDLVQFVPQANNFVVFNNYFDESVNGATTKDVSLSYDDAKGSRRSHRDSAALSAPWATDDPPGPRLGPRTTLHRPF
mmetsp:Transcript_1914/g.3180  ORF Transcript_1914/g.3180 Transcript_1914/m.3180 type:complete len:105 (-) Transcript_1914:127-441(-)